MTNEKKVSWFKVFRDIQNHWLWEDKPFSKGQAWIDLIALAKYQDEDFLDRRGNLISGERGYIYRSLRSLADRWGWSRDKVKNFLKMLESDGMIKLSTKKASEKTTIYIVNYDKYQQAPTSKKTSQKPVADQSATSQKPVADIYKNIKKDKESKESKEKPAALFPPDDVEEDEEWLTGDELIARSKAGDGNGAV